MISRNTKVHLALWGVALIHGANYTIAKEAMPQYIGAYGFIFLRQSFATIAFFILGMYLGKNYKATRADWGLIIISAFFGSALNLLTFFKGLSMTSPIQASLIIVTTPIIVTALSRVVLKDHLGEKGWIGLVLGFTGTAWLILNGNPMTNFRISIGDLLVFINSISYAIYLLISKPLLDRYHFVWLTKWMSIIGLVFTAWFGIPELLAVEYSQLPLQVWASIAYVLILTTFVSFIFFGYALTHTTTSVVSSYLYLQPLTATLFAIMLGKDHLTLTKIVSGLVILAGVYLVNSGKARPGNIE